MDAIDAVVDAFVWPLRLLGIAQPAEGQLDHVPLLSIPHNAIVNHLIPALTDKEKTMLSCTCKILWQLVASTVTQLKLGQTPGTLCVASKSPRLREFTNVTSLQLTVQGWHDIGFAAPQLLLHLSTSLPKLQEVTLLDKSHEDLYEPLASTPTTAVAQAAASAASNLFHAAVHMATGADGEGVICEGCGYDTELPDLTSVLMSLLALYPGLKKLEVYTKLLSIAEVGALSRLPQLTSLTLNSEDGVAPGALCSLSQLKKLQELRLGDVDGNNPNDIDTICDMVSRLTSLHMGYCPRLQPPVLRKVRQVQMAVDKYIQEEREKAEAERKRLEFQAAGIVGKAARLAASAATTVASTATSAATDAAASAATAVLPSFITGGSSSRKHDSLAEAPAGPNGTAPHLRESERMLIDSGVPAEMFEQGNTGSTALSAAAAAAPKSEGSNSMQQQEHIGRQRQGTDDQVETPAANADGAESATEDVPGDVELPAAASLYDPVRSKPITSAHFINQSATGKGVSNSPEATFRLVTELSVNIDAEEGEEILYEMSQLSLLESLLVDSTDEFSFDPGFQPFEHTTNLRKLAITMPMSLANTQSLQRCRQLRELLLCTLPRENLGKGSLSQVTRLELLDIAPSPPNADLLQAFPRITHLVIRKGADDDTLVMIGNHMTTLEHLELYRLPAGYSQTGLRGIAHLRSLKSLILELASPGTTLGDRATRQYHIHNPLVMPFTLVSEVGSEISAAAGSMGVPLLGTNPILAFAPPSDWGLINRLGFHHPSSHANNWFPSLTDLSVQGYVAAADRDLHALSHLTKVSELSMHVQRPRGIAGRVTLRGLWNLVEMSPQLAVINLSGYMETQLLVPGRVPGVGY